MKTNLLLILFSFSLSISFAQEQKNIKIDSLTTILRKSKDNEQKIEVYFHLNREYRGINKDSSLAFSGKALYLSKKIKSNEQIALSHALIGETYREMGNFPEMRKHFDIAINVAPDNLEVKGDVNENFGHYYRELSDSTNAISYYNKSINFRIKDGNDEKTAFAYYNLAHFYSSLNKQTEAQKNYLLALPLFKKVNNKHQIAVTSANLGKTYDYMFQYQEAIKYLHEALKYYEETNNAEGILWMQHSIASNYSDIGNYEKSAEFIDKLLNYTIKNNQFEYEILGYLLYTRMYLYSKEFDKALKYGQIALQKSEKINHRHFVADSYYYLAETSFFKANYQEAVRLFLVSLEMAKENNLKFRERTIYCPLGESYLKLNQLDKAKENLEIALRLDKEMGANLTTVYKSLAAVYEKSGDFNKAYAFLLLSYDERDKFQRVEAKKLSVQLETDRKEKELRSEQSKKDKQNLKEITEKKNQRNLAIVGLIFLSILTLILLYLFRLRNKKIVIEKQNIELKHREIEAIKEKELFKSRFLANISHEFRTPLTLIKGNTDVLAKEIDSKHYEKLEEINKNGEHLLTLINQLLDLSKMENGKFDLQFSSGNLLNEVLASISAFNSYAEQEEISLLITTSEQAKAQLENNFFQYSSEAIQTIINNLLSNAIKFTPTGGTVSAFVDFGHDILTLKITDTGNGIAEEYIEKVFDRFFQIEESYINTPKGSGIGLALVKEFAVLHQGDVRVENNESGGCTFTVWLTCEKSENENVAISSEKTYVHPIVLESENLATIDSELPIILVIEDQPELRKFIINNIGNDYQCLEASNGKIGFELAQQHIPDLIISDVMMPEMNGFELCEKVKENELTSHIPVILLTAKADEADKISGLELGADDYILKPFSVDEVKLKVRNFIRLQQSLKSRFSSEEITLKEETPKFSERDQKFVTDLKDVIQVNISNEQFSVVTLAESVHLSQSQLTRKLKAISGYTPSDLIRIQRLENALRILRKGGNVSDAAYESGFNDPSYFSKVFKSYYKVVPSDFHTI